MARAKKTTTTKTVRKRKAKVDGRIGSKSWMARSSHGRKPIFKNAEALWDACIQYFDWAFDNPLKGNELVKHRLDTREVPVAKMRPMTISGLCIFLDISENTWINYRARPEFEEVTGKVDMIIYTQKFEGAAAGLLNPSIIARELGLADRQTITTEISEADRAWLYGQSGALDASGSTTGE